MTQFTFTAMLTCNLRLSYEQLLQQVTANGKFATLSNSPINNIDLGVTPTRGDKNSDQ